MKYDPLNTIHNILITEWCDEFPYGESCKHCTEEFICSRVGKALREAYDSLNGSEKT